MPGRNAANCPRALIVEDDDDSRTMYAEHLREEGWHVHEVADGKGALHAAKIFKPDAIVMDIAMPEVDGIEATRRLKRDASSRKIPVVIVTAYPAMSRDAFVAGCEVFLTKPCSPEQLHTVLATMVRHANDTSA